MSLKPVLIVSTLLSLAFAVPALAQTSSGGDLAVGAGVGTDGGEILAAYRLNDRLVLRGQGAFLHLSRDFDSSDARYRGKLTSNLGGAFVDWHLAANPIFVSAGVDVGDRKARVEATPTASAAININGAVYTAAQIGSVSGEVKFANASPVLTLGWDNTFHGASHWGFRAQAGVLFAGDPKVRLDATGPFAADPTVQANLRAEEASLRRDARDFRFYPLVSAALTYRF